LSQGAPTAEVYVTDREGAEVALMLDPTSLDPNLHYRFVQDSPLNIAKKRARGYRLVSRTRDKVRTVVQLEQTADDTIRHVDMVLMCTSKENFLRRRQTRRELVRDRLQATHESFKEKVDEARSAGIDVRLVDKYDDSGPPDKEDEA
jgi:hypothetical protein